MVHGAVPGGGSQRLVELIDEHGEALEWDLLKLGVDLLDVYRGDVAPSTVIRRVHELGRYEYGSALQASVQKNPDLVGWDRHMSIGADLWDAVVGVAPRKKGKKAPTYPRPKTKRNSGIPLASLAPHRRRRG